jgi:hypothetical protein
VRAAPNREMAADWRVSPWRGKIGDGGGRKRAEEGRGGSVTGADERRLTWLYAEKSGGGGRKEGATVGSFEAEAGEAGER